MKATPTICNLNQRTPENTTLGIPLIGANDDDSAPSEAKFIPTLFELELLARHWLNTRMEIDLAYFLYEQTGSAEARLDLLAQERMEHIRQAMGQDNYARFAAGVEIHLTGCNSRPTAERSTQPTPAQPTIREFPDDCDRLEWDHQPLEKWRLRYVYEANRHGGEMGADLVPTVLELELITRHWLFTYLDTSNYCDVANQSGSTEYRLILYSDRRLDKLRRALGDERYLRVCAEVDREFEKRFGQEELRSFRIPEK